MSNLSQFTITSAEKDDFYGFHRVPPTQTLNKITTILAGNQSIFEYNLGIAFDTSTASYSKSFSINSEDTNPLDIRFGNSGLKMYVVGNKDKVIDEYNLTSAFDISTASWRTHYFTSDQESDPTGLAFNSAGTKMFVVGNAVNAIHEYALGTAWQVETATFTDSFSVSGQDTSPRSLRFNADGTLMFLLGDDGNDVGEYELTTGFDVSTATFIDAFAFTSEDTSPIGIGFNTLGTKIYVAGSVGQDVMEYPLVTGFDISTTQALTDTYSLSSTPGAPVLNPRGLEFNTSGSKMYLIGDAGKFTMDGIVQDNITFLEGNTYIFNVADSSMIGHTLKFSTTSDGTHAGGTEYTSGVTASGTAGSANAKITVVVPSKTPSTDPGSAVDKLYYYNGGHTISGGEIATPEWKGNLQITYTNAVDNIDTRYKTKNQEDIFEESLLFRAGLDWSVVNGNLTVDLG